MKGDLLLAEELPEMEIEADFGLFDGEMKGRFALRLSAL